MRFLRLAAVAALAIGIGAAAQAAPVDLSPEQPGRPHTGPNRQAIALLPKNFSFATPGALTIATAPSSPPLSTYSTDTRTVVGSEPDFASLLAEALGLKLVLLPVSWAEWPLGLQSGKFDAVISNITVTEERKLKFDFSTYRKDDLGFHVATSSKITSIREPKDVAGLRIIVSSGTNQEKILLEWDRQNVAKGLKPVEIQYYNDQALRDLALQSGRADALLGPNAHGAYRAALDGRIRPVGIVNGGWPLTAEIAVATRKDSGLADAFTAAINGLIADGSYAKVLQRWNLEAEGVERSRTNPPGLPRS
ncbi:Periplasmic binding protein [Rhodovastum atsumiense]|uniref:ABC transporter substrate-binding protein n=1 Tax=Rhodovastum atsumiense TaxID=504468 RepID=A0A5M6J1G3_9PROT|nr:ABC transporter substrate-binding protein [Rhodovastum atsumiense]KAA5614049.1 ABC transporter substrate-binding protein [Rhodovastum atsumiense]CAH2598863.1 Periplasmic binding protein [Rhodovastum atsumiense]